MYYVQQAVCDLEQVISSNKNILDKVQGQSMSRVMRAYTYQLDELLSIIKAGNIREALYYAIYNLETYVRDMIPHTTYEILGGRLLHRKDMSFVSSEVIDDEYFELVESILSNYANDNITRALELERELFEKISPYALKKI